ncbi:MAG: hypothetical protein WCD86_22670, partial [Ktedonobacteraceae bacterium]
WHWLPGGREVWWPTYAETHSRQTQAEAQSCEAASAAPAFVSEVVENCSYNWAIGILDIESGKIKYLVPFRKNPPLPNSMERELSSFSADISPDGAHLVLLSNMAKPNTIPSVNQVSNIDVLDRGTLRVEGRYSWNGASTSPMFSSDSRYFAVRAFKSGRSAMIFELPKINVNKEGE